MAEIKVGEDGYVKSLNGAQLTEMFKKAHKLQKRYNI